jgi:hypothetical protein
MERVIDAIGNINKADVDDFIANVKAVATATADIVRNLGQIFSWVNKIDKAWGSADAWIDKAANRWGVGGSGWGDYFRGQTQLFDKGMPEGWADRKAPKKPAQPKAAVRPGAGSFRGPGTAISPRATPINLRGTPIGGRSTQAAPQKVAVGGKMEVELKPPPGWSAVPTRMTSANPLVPLLFRGVANGGRA